MKINSFYITAKDKLKISVKSWLPDKKPKAILQISHGMAEHIERYHDFASALAKNGYGVYGNDQRGHGDTAQSEDDLGFFGHDKGWEKIIDDLHDITHHIKKQHPGVPVFLYGHSMGSSLARNYVMRHNTEKLQGLILSGTSGSPGAMGAIALQLARLLTKIQDPKTKSPLFDKLMFGEFNKAFRPNRTDFDWLSTDEEQVDKYINDPYCGFIFSIISYREIIKAVIDINKSKNIQKISKEIPIFLLSGEFDKVTEMTRGSKEVEAGFKNAGIKEVTHKIFKGCRHELLNEKNRKEIFQDYIDWISSHI